VLYPGLTDSERRGWEAFFRDWNQITAKFTIEDFRVGGTTATGNVRAMFEYVPARAVRRVWTGGGSRCGSSGRTWLAAGGGYRIEIAYQAR